VGVVTSVNCSATVARFIAEEVNRSGLLQDHPNIDGVIPLVHSTGCGIDYNGETFEILKRTTWGYASNPNMAGVLVVGLGCEGFQIARMKDAYGIEESDTFRTMNIQDVGGTKKTIAAGVDAVRTMLVAAGKAKRETMPASELMLALQCGGSDGYSGITANVALGVAADILVKHGGTAVLAETPEIYGAEHLLTRRAAWRETRRHHQVVGGLYGACPHEHGQQPEPRQQGGRPHHHPRKVAGRRGQGRLHAAQCSLPLRGAHPREGLRLHGHAGV
jgi:altronate hydrolase